KPLWYLDHHGKTKTKGEKMPKWIDKILGIEKVQEQQMKHLDMLNGGYKSFSQSTDDAYQNDIYRSEVDLNARAREKVSGKHIINNSKQNDSNSKINRLIQDRPNPYMSGYDFLYKVATQYFLYNNAFILVQKDNKGTLSGLYPLSPTNVEYVVDASNEVYLKFLFSNGDKVILHMDEVAVLRRHFKDRKSTRLNSSHVSISYAVFCLKKKNQG